MTRGYSAHLIMSAGRPDTQDGGGRADLDDLQTHDVVDGRDDSHPAAHPDTAATLGRHGAATGTARNAVARPGQRRDHLDPGGGDRRNLDRPEAVSFRHGHDVAHGDLDLAGPASARPGR